MNASINMTLCSGVLVMVLLGLVSGVKNFEKAQIKWTVSIHYMSNSKMGLVIAPKWILTTAHGLEHREVIVKFGKPGTETYEEQASRKVFLHEDYSLHNATNDIALIELPNRLLLVRKEILIQLPSFDLQNEVNAMKYLTYTDLLAVNTGAFRYKKNTELFAETESKACHDNAQMGEFEDQQHMCVLSKFYCFTPSDYIFAVVDRRFIVMGLPAVNFRYCQPYPELEPAERLRVEKVPVPEKFTNVLFFTKWINEIINPEHLPPRGTSSSTKIKIKYA